MRTRNAYINYISALLLQAVNGIYGLLIPKLFIYEYGSVINGLVSSVMQLVSCLGIVEMGLGVAGMVELYAPLANGDKEEINGILYDLRRFYIKSGFCFLFLMIGIMIIYPYIISDEVPDKAFVQKMVLILSVNTLSDFFLIDKYRVLLMADQKTYVINFVQVAVKTAVTVITYFMISLKADSLTVKAAAIPVFLFGSIAVTAITHKEYPFLSFKQNEGKHAFTQRRAAFVHQIMGFICLNTDMVLLTIFSSDSALKNVSIYAVYDLVLYAVASMISAITSSTTAGFGNLIVSNDEDRLRTAYSSYEYIAFIVIFTIYISVVILIRPFMNIYTKGLADSEEYMNWNIAVLFIISGFIRMLRFPASSLIDAAGHYQKTLWRSVAEGVINIAVSVILIPRYGIAGTLIGSIAAFLYRTIDVLLYTDRMFLKKSLSKTVRRIFLNSVTAMIVIFFLFEKTGVIVDDFLKWMINAVITVTVSGIALFIANFISEEQEMKELYLRMRALFIKGNNS